MAAPILFPNDPNLQTKTVLADADVFLIGSPANGNVVRRTTLASIKASIDIPEEFTVADIPLATTEADGLMSSEDKTRLNALSIIDIPEEFTVEDIPMATTEVDGLMSSEDKTKLDGLSNYTHPATHSLAMITETETLKVMTAEERDKLAAIDTSGGSGDVYLGTYTTPLDMLASDAEVGQYCYLELDSKKYPVFCVDEDPTVTSSWFAVGGGAVSVASEPPIITSRPYKIVRTGILYTFQIEATNSPINFSATGLPAGITCNPYTGLVSGYTTAADGVYPCTLYASNLAGTGSASISITVSNSYIVEGFGIYDAYSLKKVSSSATNCIQIRNGVGDLADIGFDANGNVDTSAILAHCGYGDGLVTRWYNQGTNKSSLEYLQQTNPTYMPHIVASGEIITVNGHPAIFDSRYTFHDTGCGLAPVTNTVSITQHITTYAFATTAHRYYYAAVAASGSGYLDVLSSRISGVEATTFYVDDIDAVSNIVNVDMDIHVYNNVHAVHGSYGIGRTPSGGAWAGFKGYSLNLFCFSSALADFSYLRFYDELKQLYNLS